MTPKTLTSIVVVLVLLGLGIAAALVVTQKGHDTAPAPLPSATTTESTSIEDTGQYYDIQATYPSEVLFPLASNSNASASAQAVLDAWIKESIATFKANSGLETLTEEDVRIQGLGEGRKYALDIHYTTHNDTRTVSYLFEVYEDSLGAHPNEYYRSFTFDATTGKELRIADIFERSGYLVTLSRISREMLIPQIAKATETPIKEFDTSYLEEGTKPDANNFQVFYFEGTDLVIVFPPYQVGPWVIGTQTIRIPRTELTAELRTEYR